MSKCKIINDHRAEIEKYCMENQLDSHKVFSFPKAWDNELVFVQYHDSQKGQGGLLKEVPAAVVLKIEKKYNHLEFEQTEYTHKYLSI